MSNEYLSAAETAKLIRTALKEAFAGVKFSVRSDNYSMGASVRVNWVDGPNTAQVEAVAKRFQGASFDGSDDSMHYHTAQLDGRAVRFAADFVFCNREFSEIAIERAIRTLRAKQALGAITDGAALDMSLATVASFKNGSLWNVHTTGHMGDSLQGLINEVLHKQSDRATAADSATMARLAAAE